MGARTNSPTANLASEAELLKIRRRRGAYELLRPRSRGRMGQPRRGSDRSAALCTGFDGVGGDAGFGRGAGVMERLLIQPEWAPLLRLPFVTVAPRSRRAEPR